MLRPSRVTVSIAICTKDRPRDFVEALDSVLADALDLDRVIVVDQSASDETETAAVSRSCGPVAIHYERMSGKGVSRARNRAIALCTSDVIAFTDDDCVVRPGWLRAFRDVFEADRTAGIAFGDVRPASQDGDGFIVGYPVRRYERITGRLGKLRDGGIGASMAIRSCAAKEAFGFDEMLGPGSPIPACEEGDLAYRLLKRGWSLHHVPKASVVHRGLRRGEPGRELTLSSYKAVAAAYFKHARCGDFVGLVLVLHQLAMATWHITGNAVRLHKPLGLRRITALLRGATSSRQIPVDRATGLFKSTKTLPLDG